MNALLQVLMQIGMSVLTTIFTEKVIIGIVIALLDYLVKSTKNDLDDKIVEIIKKALGIEVVEEEVVEEEVVEEEVVEEEVVEEEVKEN